jgi:glycosyltransferase involved in cell wall biosynthesis
MTGISVVVRTYNEASHIERLLLGLRQQTVEAEVIVVDSGSTDGTAEIAEAHRVRVEHIAPEEFSFGRSLNRGFAVASGDFVVAASAHVYPLRVDWLERLTEPLARDPLVGLAYGRQVGVEQSRYSERRVFEQAFPLVSNWNQEHPFCNNANSAVRRTDWTVQPFDESLTGLEDLAWAKQALIRGSRIAYVAEAPIAHVHDESFQKVLNRFQREAVAHRQIFPEQRLGVGGAASLFARNVAMDFVHAAREGELGRHALDIPPYRFAQFLGAWRGFRQHGPVTEALRRRFYYPGRTPPAAPVGEGLEGESGSLLIDYHGLE